MSGVDLDVGELRWQQRYGRVARELVEEHYIAGHLVAGEIVLHISLDDGLVVLSDRAEDNDRNAQLAPVHKSRLMRNCTEVETGGRARGLRHASSRTPRQELGDRGGMAR